MPTSDLEDTQPLRLKPSQPPQAPASPPKTHRRKKPWWLLWTLVFILLLGLAVTIGAREGYRSGEQTQRLQVTQQAGQTLQEQYQLGLQDLDAGRYEVAIQRFEYIVAQDPTYPGVTDKLAQVMAILYATATPTPAPPTITPTPTRDLRPVQDLFKQAQTQFAGQDWSGAIDTLIALRKSDPAYQVARVDGILFISLRQRGVDKIMHQANLEGGIYDLALAERFGPLDAEAENIRNLARLYMYGLAFWEVVPEQAVNYFGQVAFAAPGLRDASGWTAGERYRASLIQYGDQLAAQEAWCDAMTQYQTALSMRNEPDLQEKLRLVTMYCMGITPTSEVTPTHRLPTTETATPTQPPAYDTPTSTGVPPTHTPTPTSPPPTDTLPPPTDTQPPPTDTPVPTDTEVPPTVYPAVQLNTEP